MIRYPPTMMANICEYRQQARCDRSENRSHQAILTTWTNGFTHYSIGAKIRTDARNSLRRNINPESILAVLHSRENVRWVCVSRRYQSVHRILYLANARVRSSEEKSAKLRGVLTECLIVASARSISVGFSDVNRSILKGTHRSVPVIHQRKRSL